MIGSNNSEKGFATSSKEEVSEVENREKSKSSRGGGIDQARGAKSREKSIGRRDGRGDETRSTQKGERMN